MIKEVFEHTFPFNKEFTFSYKSTKYLDVVTRSETDGNLIFEFKIKQFDKPFVGTIVRHFFADQKENTRFFVYLNQNSHESALLSIGHQSNDICKIWDIYVEPSFQKLGIGKELLKQADKIARETYSRAIVVECQSSNYPAINFFQKNQFLITGFNLVHSSRDDLKRHDFLIIMSKLLD